MRHYKVETRLSTYRIYHIDANNSDEAEERAMLEGHKYDEWVGHEEVDYYDTEEIEENEGVCSWCESPGPKNKLERKV